MSATTVANSMRGTFAFSKPQTLKIRVNFSNWLGLGLVAAYIALCLLGPRLTSFSPVAQNITDARKPPSSVHWVGTDPLGRDVFSRVAEGAGVTLKISFFSLVLAAFSGTMLGLASGYFGGLTDSLLMRLVDIQLAIPALMLSLVIVSLAGSNFTSLILALSVGSYPAFARLCRGLTLRCKGEVYTEAARSVGASNTRIMVKHILPNVLPHLTVLATVSLGRVVLAIAGLGFLGFSGDPGAPELGTMVAQARDYFRFYPHLMFFPGITIVVAVMGFNLLGDGIRDRLDPYLRGRL